MSKLVLPKTYLLGYSTINFKGLFAYLRDTDQAEFIEEILEAKKEGLSDGEILCSFYAKMCYAALTTKKNKNIKKVRAIFDNVIGTIESGHGSVFEHCNINFVTTDCSRILTHELVRHRAGTAFSQTSGRYVRTDEINFVFDPILSPVRDKVESLMVQIEKTYKEMEKVLDVDNKDFATKKKLTSALRRIAPNGQSNEIGFSLNIRALRHTIEMRTSEHAEWEIRLAFGQVYDLVKDIYPAIFTDAKEQVINGLRQITFKHKKI